jgi:hypothetical protein
MKTDDLIARLAADATPVRPMEEPRRAVARWVAAVLAFVVAGAVVMALTPTGLSNLTLAFVLEHGLALVAGTALARAAFSSVIPGDSRRYGRVGLAAGLLWVASVVWTAVRDYRTAGSLMLSGQTDWPCVAMMAMASAGLGAALLPGLRRGVVLTPVLTVVLAGLAALSMADIAACLARAHVSGSVVLVWHGTTFIVVTAVLALTGRRLLSGAA